MVGDVNSRNYQAYLLRFKANYIEKIRGYPDFSLWIPTALVRSLSRHRPGRKKKHQPTWGLHDSRSVMQVPSIPEHFATLTRALPIFLTED